MKKQMEKLAEQLETMYLTESPINLNDDDFGYEYFVCCQNTHKVVRRTKNIADMIEELQDIIQNGSIDGNGEFH